MAATGERNAEGANLAPAVSTGLVTSRASRYFVKRRKSCSKVEELVGYSPLPKLEPICDCGNHLILNAYATRGPMVDLNSFRRLLFGTLRRVGVDTILADAGYDTEFNHCFARDGCNVRSVIPPRHGRPSKDPNALPKGRWRRLMKRYRDYRKSRRS